MTTHPSQKTGASQCDLILARLQESSGQWVSLLDLYRASGSMAVHSRINDLRQRGHQIEHRNEHVNGQCHSSYRLLSDQCQMKNARCSMLNEQPLQPQLL